MSEQRKPAWEVKSREYPFEHVYVRADTEAEALAQATRAFGEEQTLSIRKMPEIYEAPVVWRHRMHADSPVQVRIRSMPIADGLAVAVEVSIADGEDGQPTWHLLPTPSDARVTAALHHMSLWIAENAQDGALPSVTETI